VRPRDAILGLLSFAAGAIDALSFVQFGVFTSAMSGNTVLLGIAVGRFDLDSALAPIIAFGGYGLGVVLGTAIIGAQEEQGAFRTLHRALSAEAVLLATFLALDILVPRTMAAVLATVAFAACGMGVQGTTARQFRAPGINTVVFTSTLTSIVGALAARIFGQPPRRIQEETWRQIVMLAIYFAGAAASVALLRAGSAAAALPAFCAALSAIRARAGADEA
jgi:uncharacterized membrane protein YoaK (UPF0700 family)